MYGKNLKITTKLRISAAAFLLPLGIMLFSIITVSLSSIRKDRNELKGIDVLRPAISLMQAVPQYIRITVDNVPGDQEYTRQYVSNLLDELINKYEAYFGSEAGIVLPSILLENSWYHISEGRIETLVLNEYAQIIHNLFNLIVYVGDISGLVTDSELEGAYLVAAAVNELPQAQERIVTIGNILRIVGGGTLFSGQQRAELVRNLELLAYFDNARIQNRFNAAETLRIQNTEAVEQFEILLKACYDSIAYFSDAVGYGINALVLEEQVLSTLYEVANRANNAAYRLQDASLDRLETLISGRIQASQRRLVLSLSAAAAATLAAFAIVFVTARSIRKSTDTLGRVFKRLNENDLSVQIEALSGDEFGEFMTALACFLEKLQTAFASFSRNASMVSTAVYEISSSAKEITTTANEQSASVAEIVSTMENNKNLSTQVAVKTVEVADLEAQTERLSHRGAVLRDVNEDMMLDIRNQNAKTIEIIKNLADMLSHIDESIQLIDTIADHTKLIAFNAALEASSSGEAGLRFAVVAGEIRRFADNVVESATEIKEKIAELQDASQTLISEADYGYQAIEAGYSSMIEQKEVFENIVDASENVVVHSQQISNLSKQQELASAQVFTALKEISAGVSQFVTSTALTSAAADKLNSMSIELKETLAKYQIENRRNV